MKKKHFMALSLSLVMTMCLCTCGVNAASSDADSPATTEVSDEAAEAAEKEASDETAETAKEEALDEEKPVVILPEDDGMAGVYNWVEMETYGVPCRLLLWNDGTGKLDILGTGTVNDVVYDDETMQVMDEGTVPQKYAYADDKLTWTYTDEDGDHVSTFIRLTAEERAAYEELGVGTVTETEEENTSIWPEDNGGVAGVYKWVEMDEIGITANLIIYDDGTGILDMLGVVETVKYDDTTMQSSGEGSLPHSYTYEDGTLTWTSQDEEKTVSTFVKLTADELAEYEARGIGSAE